MVIPLIQLDPANSNWSISNYPLFRTLFSLDLLFSHSFSAILNSCYVEQFFVFPCGGELPDDWILAEFFLYVCMDR